MTQHVTTMEIQREQPLQRPKFQPTRLACDVMVEDSVVNRRGVVARIKAKDARDDANSRCEYVEKLLQQRQLMRETDGEAAEVWSAVVNSLPLENLNFASQTLSPTTQTYLSGEGEWALLMAVSCVEGHRHLPMFSTIAQLPWS